MTKKSPLIKQGGFSNNILTEIRSVGLKYTVAAAAADLSYAEMWSYPEESGVNSLTMNAGSMSIEGVIRFW